MESVGARTPVEVTFSFRAEEAHSWPSKQAAQTACSIFAAYDITVAWAEGGPYVCKAFQVEERAGAMDVVIFCEGPFTFKATGPKSLRVTRLQKTPIQSAGRTQRTHAQFAVDERPPDVNLSLDQRPIGVHVWQSHASPHGSILTIHIN
jgi:hypothetical protein